MQYNLRPLKREEYSMLEEFLYDAIFVPSGEAPPPRSVLLEPFHPKITIRTLEGRMTTVLLPNRRECFWEPSGQECFHAH